MNKKKIIIYSSVVIGILIIIFLIFLLLQNNRPGFKLNNNSVKPFVPEFMSLAEKKSLDIPESANIQVLNRNTQGGVTVYKIINNNSDVIDPAQIKSISPRASQ